MREKECRSETSMVWAVGGNSRGQLGIGRASPSHPVPSTVAFQLASHQRIVEVFCGYEHTFALTSEGDVLGFGNGVKGQLGIGNTDSHSKPQRVHLLCGKGVVKMAAGLEHSLALTESGDLYSFGDNLSGQLGLGHNFTAKEQTPQKVPPFSAAKVTQMACGQDHTAVITSSGQLFTFGNNRFGALGLPGHNEEGPPIVASNPQWVSTLSGKCIVQIGCGLQHTVALTRTGHVYTWGHNSRGQLGTGDTKDRFTPSQVCKPLSAAKCIHVACGGQHTLALTEHDDVFGFGSDRHGQLGLGQGGYIFPVPSRIVRLGGRRVQHCVGGAWHTAIRTDTGDNYVMGCILPAAESGDEASPAPAPLNAPLNELNRRSSRATATGAATPSDPFALSYGGFRRLMLPRGSEACSKGHSLFYGPGLGAPPGALRKVVKSLVRLKADLSRMLVQQKPDVVFTESMAASSSHSREDAGGMVAEAHLAVLRARCPRLFSHAAAAIRKQVGEVEKPRETDDDGRPVAWRIPSFPGVPIEALQLLIAYLYQDAGVFDKQQEKQQAPIRDKDGVEEVLVPAPAAAAAPGSSSSSASSPSAHFPPPTPLNDNASLSREPDRMRERRERLSMRARARATGGGEEEMSHGTIKATMEPFEGDMHGHGYGEDEAAAGFGSFGNAYGSPGKYDGAGLDRLMTVMAAARRLGLTRLQGLCEKRAEAFIDCPTVHKVLRLAAEGGFPYLKRRCLEFSLTRLNEVCAPENTGEVVRELSQHPSVLADVLSLAAASDGARQAAAREVPYHGAGKAPCIETLSRESPCAVPVEGYQEDFLRLFETVARASVVGELHRHRHRHEEAATPRSGVTATKASTVISKVTATADGPPARRRFEGDVWESKEEEAARNQEKGDQDAGGTSDGSHPLDPVEARGDFKIRAGEGMPAVTVHRCILIARSGFFRALLEGGMGDAKKDELILRFEPVVCLEALLEFLRFLYTGRTGVMEPLTALDVLFLTKGEDGSGGFFQITANDDLRAFSKSTIINGINNANALPILVRAKALGDEETMETAIAFILDNFDACMRPREEKECKDSRPWSGGDAMPACLVDDESPVVDLLLAMAKRCKVTVNPSNNRLEHATSARAPGRG